MNNKITNPYLKKLISEISTNASKGRFDLSWSVIEEAKNKKKLKKEAGEKRPAPSDADATADSLLGGADETPKNPKQAGAPAAGAPAPAKADANLEADAEDTAGSEETDQAKKDAAKAKAELEKAKAEKEQAEKEIKKHAYISLGSSSGTQFLLGKVLDHAFKTNTIDALAGEMVNTLKINTPEDLSNFSEDVVTYMNIPGMPELLSSMKTLANKEPETPEEPTA
jgi:hypothetical protein